MEVPFRQEDLQKILIGKLVGRNPVLNMDWILNEWKPDSEIRVTKLERDFFKFIFDSEEDFFRIWARGKVFTEKQCLLLRKWDRHFELDDRSMSYDQIWIRLPGLHHHDEWISDNALVEIGGSVGQPIAFKISQGEIYMCVEIDVNGSLITGVMVDGENGGFWQPMQYEVSMLCFKCGRTDHTKEDCVSDVSFDEYGPQNLAPIRHSKEHIFASLKFVAWRPPRSGWVKLNFDGAVKGGSGRGGGGGLLRDDEGELVGAFMMPIQTTEPLMGEIYALQQGLVLAIELGVEHIWIEGDSRVVIEMINGWKEVEDGKGVIVDCQKLMKMFKRVTARHIFREANQSADHLANLGVEACAHREWLGNEEVTSFIATFLMERL